MRAKRIDANQNTLVAQMRQIPGLTVRITSQVGEGFVDAVIGYRGHSHLLEIKDPNQPPSKRRLTPDEKQFHESFTGSIHVVETIDDVLKIISKNDI